MLQGGILCSEVGSYVFLLFVMFPSSHMLSFQRLTSQSFYWEMPLYKGNTLKSVPLNYHLTQALILVMHLSLSATFYT